MYTFLEKCCATHLRDKHLFKKLGHLDKVDYENTWPAFKEYDERCKWTDEIKAMKNKVKRLSYDR